MRQALVRVGRVAAAGTLLGSLLTSTAIAHGEDRNAAALADAVWPSARAASGAETLADLDLADDAGRELDGAVVVAALWPKAEVRWAMGSGDSFQAMPIDRATVVAGKARVHVPDADTMRAARSADGAVMMVVDVFVEGGLTSLLLERRVAPNGRWASVEELDAKREGGGPLGFRVGRDQIAPLALPATNQATAAPMLRDHQGATCSAYNWQQDMRPAETLVTAASTKGVTIDIKYTSTAATSSSLGVNGGLGGGWSISGTASRTSTVTADFNTVTGSATAWSNKEWRATYTHAIYVRHCVDPRDVTYPYNDTWIAQRYTEPVKVTGFPAIIDSRYSLPTCARQDDLSGVKSISTDTQTSTKYIAGFAFGTGVGTFTGDSQSNYTTSVKITFARGAASGFWYWCGDITDPGDSHRVRAGR